MDSSRQILDSLTDHIALYHHHFSSSSSRCSSPLPSNPNSSSNNPRKAILLWFFSLPAHQRQSALTVVDPDFVQILLQMQARLRSRGHGFFFLLPDMPSSPPSLPDLCFRRSRGLLSRVCASNELERLVGSSVRLFGSAEGERGGGECSLDSMTVCEDFVKDEGRFVAAMDQVSGGGFLRGEVDGLGSAWEELPWLKVKGYYSLEAFVANKLEVALRLSWLYFNGRKRQRGVKSKDKASGVAGLAANVFSRKRGCVEWWLGLDAAVRKKIFMTFLGKGAKSLAKEMLRGSTSASNVEMFFSSVGSGVPPRYDLNLSCQKANKTFCELDPDLCLGVASPLLSRKSSKLSNLLNGLTVLHEIASVILAQPNIECEIEKVFFSTLDTVNLISDCILRRQRAFLMLISSDYLELELMGDAGLKLPLNIKEKLAVNPQRGKKKGHNSKNPSSTGKPSRTNPSLQYHSVGHGSGLAFMEDCSSRAGMQEKDLSTKANGKVKPVSGHVPAKGFKKEPPLENVIKADHKVGFRKKKSGRKGAKSKGSCLKEPVKLGNHETNITVTPSHTPQNEMEKSFQLPDSPTIGSIAIGFTTSDNLPPEPSNQNAVSGLNVEKVTDMNKCTKTEVIFPLGDPSFSFGVEHCQSLSKLDAKDFFLSHPGKDERFSHGPTSSCHSSSSYTYCSGGNLNLIASSVRDASGSGLVETARPVQERDKVCSANEIELHSSGPITDTAPQLADNLKLLKADVSEKHVSQKQERSECYVRSHTISVGGSSYEWPSVSPIHFPSVHSYHLPPATDRLHLDVGRHWPNQLHRSFLSTRNQGRRALIEGGSSRIIPSLTLPVSLDWPPTVRSCSRLSQSVASSYDSIYNSRLQPPFCSGLSAHGMQIKGTGNENERKYSGDIMDLSELKSASDLVDDAESHWMSEDESDMHTFSGIDYNQFFGGGVMYWNTSDHIGTGFSRPPSHSSEDSSWAWHEADLNRAIDDMVGMPGLSASYVTNGLASPPATPFCSAFDALASGQQSLSYVMPGNDINGLQSPSAISETPEEKLAGSLNNAVAAAEAVKGDSLPYPVLRPIIVPSISRKGSRSEFKHSQDHKSPCVPSTRRETPRIKRPPSPMVLCVPRAPRPPPPSPVGESKKHRGFPVVRSGSSSPRHWGMRGWYHVEAATEEAHFCLDGAEVVWPSWGNNGLADTQMMQPISGSLLQDRLIAISQLAHDQEHPDIAFAVQPPESNCPSLKMSLSMMHSLLHEEIDSFCRKVAAENLTKKPYINWAVKRVARSLQVLWPRSRTNIFGSNATGLALPSSDVDLVVCLPPVRNLEPIKEAGILEGRNGIKETCLQIPLIMLIAEVPHDIIATSGDASTTHALEEQSPLMTDEPRHLSHPNPCSSENFSLPACIKIVKDGGINAELIRVDISFKSPSHTGLQTTELVRELTEQFPASIPLALVLKQFLADRSLDHSYSGGLSSYCLVLLITRFLQHEHHLGRPNNQNLGSLLMDFLYFFGNIFDPRQMRISIQGSGIYMNRERGQSIDPIHIDDPLYPTNNVGKNCFRIHQCIKAFADAYSTLEGEFSCFSVITDPALRASFKLLPKIIPSIDCE